MKSLSKLSHFHVYTYCPSISLNIFDLTNLTLLTLSVYGYNRNKIRRDCFGDEMSGRLRRIFNISSKFLKTLNVVFLKNLTIRGLT